MLAVFIKQLNTLPVPLGIGIGVGRGRGERSSPREVSIAENEKGPETHTGWSTYGTAPMQATTGLRGLPSAPGPAGAPPHLVRAAVLLPSHCDKRAHEIPVRRPPRCCCC